MTRGRNGYQNKSQHRKVAKEKNILPPLQPGPEPETFCSRVRRSTTDLSPLLFYQSELRSTGRKDQNKNVISRILFFNATLIPQPFSTLSFVGDRSGDPPYSSFVGDRSGDPLYTGASVSASQGSDRAPELRPLERGSRERGQRRPAGTVDLCVCVCPWFGLWTFIYVYG